MLKAKAEESYLEIDLAIARSFAIAQDDKKVAQDDSCIKSLSRYI